MLHQELSRVIEVPKEIEMLILYFAKKYSLNPRFLHALVETESGGNRFAMRYEPAYPYLYSIKECAEMIVCSRATMEMFQKTSWGLCQIMGSNLYEYGFKGWPAEVLDSEVNLKWGCEFLIRLMKAQGLSFSNPDDVYCAYNAGSVRKVDGRYVNSPAVTRFMKNYNKMPHDYGLV